MPSSAANPATPGSSHASCQPEIAWLRAEVDAARSTAEPFAKTAGHADDRLTHETASCGRCSSCCVPERLLASSGTCMAAEDSPCSRRCDSPWPLPASSSSSACCVSFRLHGATPSSILCTPPGASDGGHARPRRTPSNRPCHDVSPPAASRPPHASAIGSPCKCGMEPTLRAP